MISRITSSRLASSSTNRIFLRLCGISNYRHPSHRTLTAWVGHPSQPGCVEAQRLALPSRAPGSKAIQFAGNSKKSEQLLPTQIPPRVEPVGQLQLRQVIG